MQFEIYRRAHSLDGVDFSSSSLNAIVRLPQINGTLQNPRLPIKSIQEESAWQAFTFHFRALKQTQRH